MPLMGSQDQNNEPNRAGPKSLTDPVDGTVIVLDDDQLFRTTLRITLQRAGFRTYEAEDVQTLNQIFADVGHVDVLVADNVLGDGDGWAAARALLERSPGLKVVFMSGYSAEEITDYGHTAGQLYVMKASSGLDVVEAVVKLMHVG